MERSGHHSLEGVRQYKRTNALQEVQVCKVLKTSEQFGQPQANPTLYRAPQPATQPSFSFQECTFNNCTFQLPQAQDEDFSDINVQEFLRF